MVDVDAEARRPAAAPKPPPRQRVHPRPIRRRADPFGRLPAEREADQCCGCWLCDKRLILFSIGHLTLVWMVWNAAMCNFDRKLCDLGGYPRGWESAQASGLIAPDSHGWFQPSKRCPSYYGGLPPPAPAGNCYGSNKTAEQARTWPAPPILAVPEECDFYGPTSEKCKKCLMVRSSCLLSSFGYSPTPV